MNDVLNTTIFLFTLFTQDIATYRALHQPDANFRHVLSTPSPLHCQENSLLDFREAAFKVMRERNQITDFVRHVEIDADLAMNLALKGTQVRAFDEIAYRFPFTSQARRSLSLLVAYFLDHGETSLASYYIDVMRMQRPGDQLPTDVESRMNRAEKMPPLHSPWSRLTDQNLSEPQREWFARALRHLGPRNFLPGDPLDLCYFDPHWLRGKIVKREDPHLLFQHLKNLEEDIVPTLISILGDLDDGSQAFVHQILRRYPVQSLQVAVSHPDTSVRLALVKMVNEIGYATLSSRGHLGGVLEKLKLLESHDLDIEVQSAARDLAKHLREERDFIPD